MIQTEKISGGGGLASFIGAPPSEEGAIRAIKLGGLEEYYGGSWQEAYLK